MNYPASFTKKKFFIPHIKFFKRYIAVVLELGHRYSTSASPVSHSSIIRGNTKTKSSHLRTNILASFNFYMAETTQLTNFRRQMVCEKAHSCKSFQPSTIFFCTSPKLFFFFMCVCASIWGLVGHTVKLFLVTILST